MRFGLSDLEELPSLKEFEQLAQAALGSDEGIAPVEPEGSVVATAEPAPLTEPPATSISTPEDSESARAAAAGSGTTEQGT
jgi:hypothetical protein